MNTLIVRTLARVLIPLMVGFSVYLLYRGHDAVGGGFIGALVAGAAIVMQYLAWGPEGVRRWGWLHFDRMIGAGLVIAVAVGLGGLVAGAPFLSTAYVSTNLPVIGEFSVTSSLIFDVGVYLVVVGMVLAAVRLLGERRA